MIEPNKILKLIPYKRPGENQKNAAIVAVECDIDGLTSDEIQVIGHISDAIDKMNPIYVDQSEPMTGDILDFVDRFLPLVKGDEKEQVLAYRTMVHIQNGLYDKISKKNNLFLIPKERVLAIIPEAENPGKLFAIFQKVKEFLYGERIHSQFANLYPDDISSEDLDSLKGKNKVNSRVARRSDGSLYIEINEERYKDVLAGVIVSLEKAMEHSEGDLKKYIEAKIQELKTGHDSDRITADIAMIQNTSKISFNLSTALEVYLDDAHNIRGAATGNVFVIDDNFKVLMGKLIELMPQLEKDAPWELRKEDIDVTKLPKINYVNVFNQSGDYISAPANTVAQSLPNEQDIKEKYGTVNYVYKNISEALFSSGGRKSSKEFLPKDVEEKYGPLFKEISLIHYTTHELGHTTGLVSDELQGKKPGEILKNGLYSAFEEARAELFSMYTLPVLSEKEVITEEQMVAGYHNMIVGLVANLKFEAKQAHTIARNMMFHYFLEKGGISTVTESGKERFFTDLEKIDGVVREMLRIIADFKSFGKTEAAAAFKEKYCRKDNRFDEIEERTKNLPVGRGLIFPRFKKEGEFLSEMSYTEYNEQPVFKNMLIL